MTVDFSTEITESRRQLIYTIKVLKENNWQSRHLCLGKISFRNKDVLRLTKTEIMCYQKIHSKRNTKGHYSGKENYLGWRSEMQEGMKSSENGKSKYYIKQQS